MTKLWTVAELSERLNVPPGWVYDRTRREGPELIPHIKLGRYIRFNPESQAFQRRMRSNSRN